jgi:polyhydroxybutyrate depolymerase
MKNYSIFFYAFIAAVLLTGASACGRISLTPVTVPSSIPSPVPSQTAALATLKPVDSQRKLTINGLERSYLLHIPLGLVTGQPVPLVFVFHGLGEAANLIQQASGMNAVSDTNGFIVVYPNGSGSSSALSWNAGKCCGYALQNNIDETAYIRQIIADVGTFVQIDPKRIYASGFSNGGLLSYRLACEMSDTFAAIAPVAGVMLFDQCQPKQPVALIDFHGLSDNVVPIGGGGIIPDVGQPFPPVEDSIAAWVKFDDCVNPPQIEQTTVFTHTSYSSCQSNSAVEFYAIKGIGHSWPSQYVVQASQKIWDFFKAHPKQ